jgi:hypothetical protein
MAPSSVRCVSPDLDVLFHCFVLLLEVEGLKYLVIADSCNHFPPSSHLSLLNCQPKPLGSKEIFEPYLLLDL